MEKSVKDAVEAIAGALKKHVKEHEDFMLGLRKSGHEMEKKSPPGHEKQVEHIAESYEEKGKSAGQAKAIAAATAWKQHKEHGEHSKEAAAPAKKAESCKKCGKAECMGKCDMSDVKPEGSMSKSEVIGLEQFLEVIAKAEESSDGKDPAPLSFTDKKMGGKGPAKVPASKEVSAPGSGDDKKAGKPEKAPALTKGVYDIKAEESHKEESSSKEESSKSKEKSELSKSLNLIADLVKAFDHPHAAPMVAPAHAPAAGPVLHAHAGPKIPQAVGHKHPMHEKLEALKAKMSSMKGPKIPSVK